MTVLRIFLLASTLYVALALGAYHVARAISRYNARRYDAEHRAAARAEQWARRAVKG